MDQGKELRLGIRIRNQGFGLGFMLGIMVRDQDKALGLGIRVRDQGQGQGSAQGIIELFQCVLLDPRVRVRVQSQGQDICQGLLQGIQVKDLGLGLGLCVGYNRVILVCLLDGSKYVGIYRNILE